MCTAKKTIDACGPIHKWCLLMRVSPHLLRVIHKGSEDRGGVMRRGMPRRIRGHILLPLAAGFLLLHRMQKKEGKKNGTGWVFLRRI